MNTDKKLKLEIGAVMLLTVGRSLAYDIGVITWLGSIPSRPFGYSRYIDFVSGLYLSGLVMFVVSLKQESWVELGLSSPRWAKDVAIGLLLVLITAVLFAPFVILVEMLGPLFGEEIPKSTESPLTLAEYLWIFVSAASVGFGEELLMRGYLISRLLRLFGPGKSVFLSSLIFSAWHVSQGILGVTRTFTWGLVYGFTFIRTRRLWPLAIAHAVHNSVVYLISG